MIALVAALSGLWLQGGPPDIKASVDRDHVTVGDEIVYTVRALSESAAPIQLSVPSFPGFELVERSERSEVSHVGGPSRTSTIELRLRAIRPGRWQLGPARATQGGQTVLASIVALDVDDLPGAATVASNPMLRKLLERAPPPAQAGQPAVTLVLSARSGAVGEQVDVLTAAWFPRELRVQLRRPPTLQPPVIEGVWSYPQPVPAGIAATRTIGGTTYDLFVAHQVIFPLVAGRIPVEPAILKYSVPLALQFFSQEQRYTLTSNPDTLTVAPTPTGGRPPDYAGAVGTALRLDRTVEPRRARTGEPVTVCIVLSGDGNPSLWPAPELRWPAGLRAYPDRTDERLAVAAGRLGGAKTFSYTVVPDSAGSVGLPGVSYTYYDLESRAYRTASLAPDRLVVAPASEARASRPLPPPLLRRTGPPLAWRALHETPPWLLPLALGVPPLGYLARWGRLRFRRRRWREAAPATPGVGLEIEALIHDLIPAPDVHSDTSLVGALRTAGVEPEVATRLVAVRNRLLALRYGPKGGPVPPELAAEARQLIRRAEPAPRALRALRAIALPLALLLAWPARAQAPSPEQLYERGALGAAAAAFARETAEQPADPAGWYNLGAAYFRLGLDGRAVAAWLQASRFAPRERSVHRALGLVPLPESASAARVWSPPVTWEELALLSLPLWMAGWLLLTLKPRRRDVAVVALAASLVLAAGAVWLRERQQRPLAILLAKIPLQLSPHERAPTVAPLEPGSALLVLRRAGGWLMVDAPARRLGWVPADSVFVLRET